MTRAERTSCKRKGQQRLRNAAFVSFYLLQHRFSIVAGGKLDWPTSEPPETHGARQSLMTRLSRKARTNEAEKKILTGIRERKAKIYIVPE